MTTTVLPNSYRRLLAASTLSNLSDGIRLAAFPLLARSLTASPLLIGLVFVAGLIPGPVFGLSAGWLSDRVERRSLARRVNTGRAMLLGGLALLIMTERATLGLVIVAAFVLGTSEVLADNTIGTLIPSVVPTHQLERANASMVASEIIGNEFVGPALGALLFSLGMFVPFASNAGLLAMSVLLLAGLPLLRPSTEETHDNRIDDGRIRDGLVFLRGSESLRGLTVASAMLIAIDGAWFALLIVLSSDVLGLPPSAFGLLLASGALGGLAGAALADRFLVSLGSDGWRRLVVGVFVSMGLPLIGLGLAPSIWLSVLSLVLSSGAFAWWNTYAATLRQRATPDHLLGRVTGAYKSIVLSAAVAGTLVGSLVAEQFGIRFSLVGAGILALAATPVLVRWPADPDATSSQP